MTFNDTLIPGELIKRYKRFLADVRLNDGSVVTAHCPNSGSMKSCKEPGWKVLLSDSHNPKRKLRYTWEMIHNGTCWIGINTNTPNKIAVEGIRDAIIAELAGYSELRTEQKYGGNSRIDILLHNANETCYVEVKNVTLVEEDGYYKFPDAVTERGLKHLNDLAAMKADGHRAVMLFVIQRSDGTRFKPAAEIDPKYAKRLKEVHNKGVEILPYRAEVTPEHIVIKERIDYTLNA